MIKDFNASHYFFLMTLAVISLFSSSTKISAQETTMVRTQLLDVPHYEADFKFDKFTSEWFQTRSEWLNFCQEKSRIQDYCPELPLNWEDEKLLAVFWESKDAVVRIPSFIGSQIQTSRQNKTLSLYFGLNRPCFGIITDSSPHQFLVFKKSAVPFDEILIDTDKTKSRGCF